MPKRRSCARQESNLRNVPARILPLGVFPPRVSAGGPGADAGHGAVSASIQMPAASSRISWSVNLLEPPPAHGRRRAHERPPRVLLGRAHAEHLTFCDRNGWTTLTTAS